MKKLLHIGYPKAGSTFLKHWFAHHPQVAFNPHGLGGLRSPKAVPTGREWLVTCDETLTLTLGNDITQIPTPQETKNRQAQIARYVHEHIQVDAILVMTRGARSLYRSAYSQYLKAGGHLTYEQLRGNSDDRYAAMWDYDYVLELYQSLFGIDRVWVFPLEWLTTSPDQFLAALEAKMGIPTTAFDRTPRNTALSDTAMGQYRTLNRVMHQISLTLAGSARQKFRSWYRNTLDRGRWNWILKSMPASSITCDPPEDLIRTLGKVSINTVHQPYVRPFARHYQ
jgi:hypothetical protein